MAFPSGIVDALDPSRLRLLVEVDRQGSISAAAEACGIGQPSASKQLKTLEAAVGERLVERNGRSSRLTQAGAVVAGHAVRVLDTLHGLQEEIRSLRAAETGTLALAACTTSGSYVLPSILQCFSERHPQVDVDIAVGASAWVAERVGKREFPLGIAGEGQFPDGIRAEPFLDDELIGIAAPGNLELRSGGRVSFSELGRQTLLLPEPGSSTRRIAEQSLTRAGYQARSRWELDSNEAIKRSVAAGLGISFVSRLVVEDELRRGDVVEFRLPEAQPMRRSIFLLRPVDRDPTPAERVFIATLSDCCSVSIAGCTVNGVNANGR